MDGALFTWIRHSSYFNRLVRAIIIKSSSQFIYFCCDIELITLCNCELRKRSRVQEMVYWGNRLTSDELNAVDNAYRAYITNTLNRFDVSQWMVMCWWNKYLQCPSLFVRDAGEAVFARCLSSLKEERIEASNHLRGPSVTTFTGDKKECIENIRKVFAVLLVLCTRVFEYSAFFKLPIMCYVTVCIFAKALLLILSIKLLLLYLINHYYYYKYKPKAAT